MDAWKPHHLLWSARPRSFRGRRVACVGNRPRVPDGGPAEEIRDVWEDRATAGIADTPGPWPPLPRPPWPEHPNRMAGAGRIRRAVDWPARPDDRRGARPDATPC